MKSSYKKLGEYIRLVDERNLLHGMPGMWRKILWTI